MNVGNLVRMANSIGVFFDAMPDRAEALDGIASHLRKFWAPSMRAALTEHWRHGAEPRVDPIVADALAAHALLAPAIPADADDPMPIGRSHDWDGASES